MKQELLDELCVKAYETACSHGFHDRKYSNEHFMGLIISELYEAVEADRRGCRANLDAFEHLVSKGSDYKKTFKHYIKDSVEDELADVCIRIFDLAGCRNIKLNSKVYINLPLGDTFAVKIFNMARIPYTFKGYASLSYLLKAIENLAQEMDINLEKHIEIKMKYNELRPRLHGKNY